MPVVLSWTSLRMISMFFETVTSRPVGLWCSSFRTTRTFCEPSTQSALSCDP